LSKRPVVAVGSPDNLDIHDEFFAEGDEGRYEGGPAKIAAETREVAALVEEVERQKSQTIVRTPEQEERRARYVRLVAGVIGFGLAVAVVGIWRARVTAEAPKPLPPSAMDTEVAAPPPATTAAETPPPAVQAQPAPGTEPSIEIPPPPAEPDPEPEPEAVEAKPPPKPAAERPAAPRPVPAAARRGQTAYGVVSDRVAPDAAPASDQSRADAVTSGSAGARGVCGSRSKKRSLK
jgi:hypothetical protein